MVTGRLGQACADAAPGEQAANAVAASARAATLLMQTTNCLETGFDMVQAPKTIVAKPSDTVNGVRSIR